MCKTDIFLIHNFQEDASIFLPKPPSVNSYKNQGTEENGKDFKEVQEQTQLNILMVGYGTGFIHMSIFGTFPFGTINLAKLLHDEYGEYKVLNINFSDDFSVLQVLYYDIALKTVCAALINTSVLSAYSSDIFTVANKHGQVFQLLSHLDQTMTSISESWEQILLEMDTKMTEYAASVPDGGVSADLLELLMMGLYF